MTDIRDQIAALIDAHISGKTNTAELASHLTNAKTVELLKPIKESDVFPAGPFDTSGNSVAELRNYFAETLHLDPTQVEHDLDFLVDQGDVPAWMEEHFAASGAPRDADGRNPIIEFGPGTAFVEYLNGCVPGAGDAILSMWDQDAGYEVGGSVNHMPDENGDGIDPATGAPL